MRPSTPLSLPARRRAWRPLLLAGALLGAALAHGHPPAQAGTLCASTATQPPPGQALRLAQLALREHAAWGGAQIDAQGRLTDAGSVEAGMPPGPSRTPAPWQRVLGYWSAVPAGAGPYPSQIHVGALRPADRPLLEQALSQASDARLAGLGVGPDQGLASHEQQAVRVALARVAVIDTPWSAAFISWLAREAGLDAPRFAFSEAHADYAAAAWAAGQAEAQGLPSPYALRTCDLTRTTPRVGDLVCQARGRNAGLDDHEALTEALQQRLATGRVLAMHCDVVTQVDAQGFDALGGNVLDTVMRRRLDFAPGTRLLDASYRPGTCEPGTAGCPRRHLSHQPWSLLLQWR
ncbi:DUF2272 domain-containing protein [Xenophilus sp. Marseille-Q4582]|uniref:DUF2272 domain-containing protein n=1 Tax=Xenophilus sp. Marseille-Q4582 TaxID=2866600 RepID=UPI001CE3C418|nr:DUF2272 domain-containing protein [Xenophilus sp. Marseille-Q4582]